MLLCYVFISPVDIASLLIKDVVTSWFWPAWVRQFLRQLWQYRPCVHTLPLLPAGGAIELVMSQQGQSACICYEMWVAFPQPPFSWLNSVVQWSSYLCGWVFWFPCGVWPSMVTLVSLVATLILAGFSNPLLPGELDISPYRQIDIVHFVCLTSWIGSHPPDS